MGSKIYKNYNQTSCNVLENNEELKNVRVLQQQNFESEMASIIPIQQKIFSKEVIVETECVFEIENFESGYKENEKINLETEKLAEVDIEWYLNCVPRASDNLCIILFIIRGISELWKTNKYQVSQSLKLTNGISLHLTNFQSFNESIIVEGRGLDFDYLLQHVTPNGSLFLIAKLEIKILVEKTVRQLNTKRITNQHIMNQFQSILNDPTFSDFTFIIKDKEFKVHKAILAGSSEVMRKIFTSDLLESNQGQCKVDDIEPEIFDYLLRFIYTGQVPHMEDMDSDSLELLKAAHYYGISDLVDICEQHLHFKVNAENAVEIYEFASIYDLNELKLDAWNIVKGCVLKIFVPLTNEPLPVEDVREIIDARKKENEILLKHIVTNTISAD